jgi:hypothetical protein
VPIIAPNCWGARRVVNRADDPSPTENRTPADFRAERPRNAETRVSSPVSVFCFQNHARNRLEKPARRWWCPDAPIGKSGAVCILSLALFILLDDIISLKSTPGSSLTVLEDTDRSDVTRMLEAIQQGQPQAAEELLPLVYEELRRLAAAKMAHQAPGQTLQATALVMKPTCA